MLGGCFRVAHEVTVPSPLSLACRGAGRAGGGPSRLLSPPRLAPAAGGDWGLLALTPRGPLGLRRGCAW